MQEQRHLKWRALDPLEHVLMILCGIAITGFCVLVCATSLPALIGHPWLWLQEATMTFFIYGIFIGVAAATRRNDHLYLAVLAESMTGNRRLFFEMFNRMVVLRVALCMIYFGYLNFLDGFKSLRMPSMIPMSMLLRGDPAVRHADCAFHRRADGQRLAQRFPDLPGFPDTKAISGGSRCDRQRHAHLPDGLPVPVPRLSWACRSPSR